MPRAFSLIQPDPVYRRDAIEGGLRTCGYTVLSPNRIGQPRPDDVLVIWNRYGSSDWQASRFEAAGAAVIVAENGYLGACENAYRKLFASDEQEPDSQLYALALNHHNGAGHWPVGAPGRWRAHGITVKPWREDGEHILVLPQRGIGPPGVAMPADWPQKTLQWLKTRTIRPVRLRQHPGNGPTQRPLEADLEGCWCVVAWGSGGALKAMCAGIPAYSDWPQWIGFPCALPLEQIGYDVEPSAAAREAMLDRLAWAQFRVDEIRTGEPLAHLLALYRQLAEAA